MKFGKIYDYRNKEEAKKIIGKKVVVSDYLCKVEKAKCFNGTLFRVLGYDEMPFEVELTSGNRAKYQFIREIEEENKPKLMTNRQLAEWLARGNGERRFTDDQFVNRAWCYSERAKNLPLEKNVRIRHWGSDEWVMPTLDIYEKDCKGIRTIE